MKIRLLFLLIWCLMPAVLVAQQVTVNAAIDSSSLLMGRQSAFRISINKPSGSQVGLPLPADSLLKGFEWVGTFHVDSVQKDGNTTLNYQIQLTSFDSGQHVIGPIAIPVWENGLIDTLYTQPVSFETLMPKVDMAKGIQDAIDPMKVPWTLKEIAQWVLPILALVLIIAGIIWYIIRRKQNKPLFEFEKILEPPHETALRQLRELRDEKLWQNGRLKDYYTRLTDVLRIYMEARFNIMALEQTSDEIIRSLASISDLSEQSTGDLRQLFFTADLVKFAKSHPLPDENDRFFETAERFVINTKPSEPTVQPQQQASINVEPAETTQN